jgi:predicted nucleic acid-binding protein
MTAVPRVFLDASVFIAAAASRKGTSSVILGLCGCGRLEALATQQVLREAERNIGLKLDDQALLRYYQDIAEAGLSLVDPASPETRDRCGAIIHPKDVHVLAAAVEGRATFLLTLDRKHFITPVLRRASLGLEILTPGEFLNYWVEHQP